MLDNWVNKLWYINAIEYHVIKVSIIDYVFTWENWYL